MDQTTENKDDNDQNLPQWTAWEPADPVDELHFITSTVYIQSNLAIEDNNGVRLILTLFQGIVMELPEHRFFGAQLAIVAKCGPDEDNVLCIKPLGPMDAKNEYEAKRIALAGAQKWAAGAALKFKQLFDASKSANADDKQAEKEEE